MANVRSQAAGRRAISLPEGAEISQVAWSPDCSLLALSSRGARTTLLVDPGSGQLRHTLEGLSGPVAWEPGGHRIAGPAANLARPSDHIRFTRPAIPGAPRGLGR